MTEKGIWAWFSGHVCIPMDKLIRLVELVDAEVVIRDKNTHQVISGNPSENDLKMIKEREQLSKIKQALSIFHEIMEEP